MMENDDILEAMAGAVRRGAEGVWLAVGGNSMGPGFAGVCEIRVVAGQAQGIPVGALIVFQRDGKWVVHRAMRRWRTSDGWLYRAKGDGLARPDTPDVRAEEVRGVVAGLRWRDGTVSDLGSSRARLRARWIVARFRLRQWLWPARRGPRPAGPV